MMVPTLKLATGDALPVIGLGFWQVEKSDAPRLAREAIRVGYRHFDCACDYGNEAEIGDGIRASLRSGLCRREGLWVTSKLWNTYHAREHVGPAAERSLKDLGVDYLDLYLIHFPIAQRYVPFDVRYPPEWLYDPNAVEPRIELAPVPIRETWEAMERLVRNELVRHIGICNFNTALLRDLLNYAKIRPSVLQVELHPFLTQEKLIRYCHQQEIVVTGYSPLGAQSYLAKGTVQADEPLLEDCAITATARKHGKTPAQVVLRWGIQRGTAIVPKTVQTARLQENISIFDFELSDDEMKMISQLNRNRRFNDPGVYGEAAFDTFCPIYD